ncbi:hypothetical protein ADK70_12770 [Streptomyces rimosus subsp. pseudoverticillatus]|uniref:hypothetical protein n=1 Tax=Streptomyces rimosus TaxID=1927 RepID=UPI0006B27115|nr:hypothetical protein [Streptomyces rimosus]KOT94536.1 hypothetical protein ADK70_12770 [Streptomyces rimosus subsp. pseudoverticillatus]
MLIPIPVPDAVTALKARHLPARVVAAVRLQADAVRRYGLARGPLYAEAREVQQSRIARANKVLATVPARGSLVVRGAA